MAKTKRKKTPEEIATKETVKRLDLVVDHSKVLVDDYYLMLQVDNKEKDINSQEVNLKFFQMLDRVVVGGILGKGIQLQDLPAIMDAVFSKLNDNTNPKN